MRAAALAAFVSRRVAGGRDPGTMLGLLLLVLAVVAVGAWLVMRRRRR